MRLAPRKEDERGEFADNMLTVTCLCLALLLVGSARSDGLDVFVILFHHLTVLGVDDDIIEIGGDEGTSDSTQIQRSQPASSTQGSRHVACCACL